MERAADQLTGLDIVRSRPACIRMLDQPERVGIAVGLPLSSLRIGRGRPKALPYALIRTFEDSGPAWGKASGGSE